MPEFKINRKWRKMVVLAQFLADYHSGQWSRGYRYLSITLRRLRSMGITYPLEYALNKEEASMYLYLVDTYYNKV